MQNNSSTQIIKLAQNGDIDALEKVLKISEKEAYSTLHCLFNDNCDISDIIQDILIKIANKIKTLKEPKYYKSWLNKIILRQYYDCMRKNKKNKTILIKDELNSDFEENIKDKSNTPDKNCMYEELIEKIKNSLMNLNEIYRIPIIMREFNGLNYNEIAQLTNTNIGTVKSRIARARCQLKKEMKEYIE